MIEQRKALRVFFAVWPDAATRGAAAALARETAASAGGKAPRPENIHLTLAFVGDVRPERLDVLRAIGEEAARTATPFLLTLDRTGGFRDGGIAWLGTEATPPELDALVGQLRGALGGAGFPVDARPFRIHVTLARRCRRRVRSAPIAPIAWRVERVALTASELASGGSRYRDLAAWRLGRHEPI